MKIAVTGASGHIGVNLCRELVKKGHAIKALVHKNTRSLQGIPLETVQGDLKDPASLFALVKDADAVFHLGAVISIRGNRTGELFDINVEGTRKILEASQKESVKRFIHFSSIHALDHSPYNQELDENRPLAIRDKMAYSRSKALAEDIVINASNQGLDTVILSPTAVIGPFDYAPSLMGRAILLMATGKLPALVPGGYDWVDVRDVVSSTLTALEKGRKGERYLLSGHWRTLEQISKLVSDIIDLRPQRFTCPNWLARLGLPFIKLYCSVYDKDPLYTRDSLYTLRTSHRNISHEKATKELGFKPRPFEETLKDTLDWFQNQGFLS
ncbi:MAG: NAD-dependent epimerase/dehydratase family protein [Candidatus Aminicenantes bacterium]|nr:NAD-dependent epimerase/dehydratase family protein [Candidatus Aminicenantes bacterium]MDH5383494.1 NAD-dependent epimerase/dehydratase family protein [Candidatus Aminicenantes bacterium]MDH5743391.1 NAD-dependent epimerase/dehydratase family protein [Candidatus Aminicenantes bacterium]